jgi:hypothetical protein
MSTLREAMMTDCEEWTAITGDDETGSLAAIKR